MHTLYFKVRVPKNSSQFYQWRFMNKEKNYSENHIHNYVYEGLNWKLFAIYEPEPIKAKSRPHEPAHSQNSYNSTVCTQINYLGDPKSLLNVFSCWCNLIHFCDFRFVMEPKSPKTPESTKDKFISTKPSVTKVWISELQ